MIKTSIIIAIQNTPSWNEVCLESLIKHTSFEDRELIIIDNGCFDASKRIIEDKSEGIPNKRLIVNSTNNGSYHAWNQGIDVAGGENICICHNDTIFTHGWLDNLEDFLYNYKDDYREIGIVSPATSYTGEIEYVADIELMNRFSQSLKFSNKSTISVENIKEIIKILYPDGMSAYSETVRKNRKQNYCFSENIATFCFLAKKSLYDRFGKFDDEFYPHTYSEKLLKYHMEVAGIKTACCFDSFVFHNGNTTTDGPGNDIKMIEEMNKSLYEDKMREYYKMALEKPY